MNGITSAAQPQAILKENPAAQNVRGAGQTDFQTVMELQKSGASIPMDTIFEAAAARYDISPKLLKAVAKNESGFDPKARSGAGAIGVMQLMPGTARSLGVTDPYDPWQNIMGGAKYLKKNLDQFGDVSLALAAYNAGPGAVQKYGGIPPYRETQNYVKKVMADYTGETPVFSGRMAFPGLNAGGIYGGSGLRDSGWLSSLALLNADAGGAYGGFGGTFDLAALYGQAREGELTGEEWANLLQIARLQMMMDSGGDAGTLL